MTTIRLTFPNWFLIPVLVVTTLYSAVGAVHAWVNLKVLRAKRRASDNEEKDG